MECKQHGINNHICGPPLTRDSADQPTPQPEREATTAEERATAKRILEEELKESTGGGREEISQQTSDSNARFELRLLADLARAEQERDAATNLMERRDANAQTLILGTERELLVMTERAEAAEQRARDAEAALRDTSKHLHVADEHHKGTWEDCDYGSCSFPRALLAAQPSPAERQERGNG